MELQFDNYIKKVDAILRSVGMSLNKEDSNRTLLNRLKYHWKCFLNLIVFQYGIVGQIVWMVLAIITGKSLLEITFLLPCMTVCLLGELRLCFFIYYINLVHDLIKRLKTLEMTNRPIGESSEEEHKLWFDFLTNVFNMLKYLTYSGVAAFIGGPFVIMTSHYYITGEINLLLPFIMWYPFDGFDIHYWPLAYAQQTQAAWMAINSIIGPDCFFFTCCTFIHLQFTVLQQDLEHIVKGDIQKYEILYRNDELLQEFVGVVKRHWVLIQCVELLDGIYSKSTLFSFATSSLIICASGFNLKVSDDYVLIVPFVAVLLFGMAQVNLHCYYGDYVMRSSMKVGDAIYNSLWYESGATVRKYLLFVLLRSQKPCKFTASGFADVNLMAFARILSSSWSYFAVLNQIYPD